MAETKTDWKSKTRWGESPLETYFREVDINSTEATFGQYFQRAMTEDIRVMNSLLLDDIKFRADNFLNWICSCEGKQGSGKSLSLIYAGLLIGKFFGYPFTAKNVIFDPDDLDSALEKAPHRSTWLMDEQKKVTVGMMSRTTQLNLLDYEEQLRRCLAKGTKILVKINGKRKYKKIESLTGKQFQILSKNFKTGKHEWANGKCGFSGKRKITKIILKDGKKIEATEDHRLFIREKGKIIKKQISNINENDDLILKRGVDFNTTKKIRGAKEALKKWWADPENKDTIKKRNEKISKKLKINNPMKNPIYIKKMVKSLKAFVKNGGLLGFPIGYKLSKQHYRNICKANKLNGQKRLGKPHPLSKTEKKLLIKRMKQNNPMKNPKIAKKVSEKLEGHKWSKERNLKIKNLWKDENHRNKQLALMIKGCLKKPNKKEKQLLTLLKEQKLPYKFVGNGQVILGGKCPDFINCNGAKKLIELFGIYWHKRKKNIKYHQTEKGTKKHYSLFGYKTLVVWEKELEEKEQLIQKLRCFDEN